MRKIAALLILVLMLFTLPSCSSKTMEPSGDLGAIDTSIAVTSPVKTDDSRNYFSPVADSFGYDYLRVEMPRVKASFEVPKAWKVTTENARHLVLQAPTDDKDFAGATIHVLFDIKQGHLYQDVPSKYFEVFGDELLGLAYNIEGNSYHQVYEMSPTLMETDKNFAGVDTMTSIAVVEDVTAERGQTGFSPKEKVNSVYYFVNWQNQPVVLSCMTGAERTENVKNLMTYMVSSLTCLDQTLSPVKEIEIEGIRLSVPEDFEAVRSNVYMCPYNGVSKGASGLGVGVFHVDSPLTEESLMFGYSKSLASSFIPVKNNNAYSSLEGIEKQIGNRSGTLYYLSGTVLCSEKCSGEYFSTAQTCYLDTYAVNSSSGGQDLIVLFSLSDQEELLEKLTNMVIPSIEF